GTLCRRRDRRLMSADSALLLDEGEHVASGISDLGFDDPTVVRWRHHYVAAEAFRLRHGGGEVDHGHTQGDLRCLRLDERSAKPCGCFDECVAGTLRDHLPAQEVAVEGSHDV